MTSTERKEFLLKLLIFRRKDTAQNLATELGVSKKTILRDIVSLSTMFPIETVRGRYGGIQMLSWYHPDTNHLCLQQLQLLHHLTNILTDDEIVIINSIIFQFS